MADDVGLSDAIGGFIVDVTDALMTASASVPGVDRHTTQTDVTTEAFNLACAFIDADERHTDDELLLLIASFGFRLPTKLAMADPSELRNSGVLASASRWLAEPSTVVEILLAHDARHGTSLTRRYYSSALQVAHTIAALDAHPSRSELDAIERFRTMLLGRIALLPTRDGATGTTQTSGTFGTSAAQAPDTPTPPTPAAPPARPLEELLAELDELVGLEEVKKEVRLVTDLLRISKLRADRNLPVLDTSRHLVFVGNPGTGKTTVARLLAQIYRTLGVVEKGHLVETDRSGMVAGYVGQTAPLVRSRFDEADGGVLFVDEAYALVRGDDKDFGREAVDTIVKLSEDRRHSTVVILAGYVEEMEELLDANPGLRSRFPTLIEFPDYSTDELMRIFANIGEAFEYNTDEAGEADLRKLLDEMPRTKGFGNGRLVRNLFEAAVARQASRVVTLDEPSEEDLTTLTAADITDAATDVMADSAAGG